MTEKEYTVIANTEAVNTEAVNTLTDTPNCCLTGQVEWVE